MLATWHFSFSILDLVSLNVFGESFIVCESAYNSSVPAFSSSLFGLCVLLAHIFLRNNYNACRFTTAVITNSLCWHVEPRRLRNANINYLLLITCLHPFTFFGLTFDFDGGEPFILLKWIRLYNIPERRNLFLTCTYVLHFNKRDQVLCILLCIRYFILLFSLFSLFSCLKNKRAKWISKVKANV